MLEAKTKLNKKRYIILIILTIVYLLVRLLILVSSIDKIHSEGELYRGNIAKELISGPILSFFDYQRSEYEGGSLVVGVLAVPFFLLFGDTLFSLKLAGLSFSLGIFILWYLFLDKFFHRRVAIWASLLHILSFPFYIRPNLSAFGGHHQINLFTILAIFIFYQIFFVKEKKSLFILLGLVSGFALFFSYSFCVTLLIILLLWFVFDRRLLLGKNFLSFALSFLLGFSPWIYYNLTHNFEGLIVADQPLLYWFTQNSLFDSLIRFKDLVITEIANSFGFRDVGFLNHHLLSNIYYLIFALSFCLLFFLNRRSILKLVLGIIPHRRFQVLPKEISKDVLLIIFPVIFCIILSFTGLEFKSEPGLYASYVYKYRCLWTIYPFIFAIIALFLHRTAKLNTHFLISFFNSSLLIILLSIGLISNFNLVTIDSLGKSFTYKIYKGYNYYDLGKIICWRFDDPERTVELIKGIAESDDQRYCYAGMGWGFAKEKFSSDYNFYLEKVINKIDRKYWPYVYERLGKVIGTDFVDDKIVGKELRNNLDKQYLPYFYRGLGMSVGKRLVNQTEEYTRLIDRINEGYQPYFHQGIGMELDEILIDDTERFSQISKMINEKFRQFIYKGLAEGKEYFRFKYDQLGFGLGRIGYEISGWNEIIDQIQEEYRPYCYQRLGIEIGWRFIHDIKRYLKFSEQTDRRYRTYLYKGLGIGVGWRFGYNIDCCVQLIEETDQRFWPYIYEGLGIGVSKRYGYPLDQQAQETDKVPPDYKFYFQRGIRERLDARANTL